MIWASWPFGPVRPCPGLLEDLGLLALRASWAPPGPFRRSGILKSRLATVVFLLFEPISSVFFLLGATSSTNTSMPVARVSFFRQLRHSKTDMNSMRNIRALSKLSSLTGPRIPVSSATTGTGERELFYPLLNRELLMNFFQSLLGVQLLSLYLRQDSPP